MGQSEGLTGPCPPKSAAFELTERADLDPLLLEPYVLGPVPPRHRKRNGNAAVSVLRETWTETLEDIRNIHWARASLWFLAFCWVAGLITCLVIVPLLWSGYYMSSACLPDGTFSLFESYNVWDINGFFQITSGFGELTFTEAKVVDVVWDVVIGRIGQTLLVVFSWRAFSLHIKASTEEGPDTRNVSYHTYWTIYMQDDISLMAVMGVIRDFIARRRLKSVAAMVFMAVTMLFCLAWPTIASAMTGYDSNNIAFIKIRDGSLIPFSAFIPLLYVIHDGSRIDGLTDEYNIPCCRTTGEDDIFLMGSNASLYAETYGFLGINNTDSIWPQNNTTLPSPALNISAFPSYRFDSYGSEWINPQTGEQPFMDERKITYLYNNEAYDFNYIITEQNGQCQPIGSYKWGFSFLQAMVAMLILWVWTLSIYIMWLRAHMKLSSRGPYEVPNRYKAAVRLSRSIAVDFGDVDRATDMSNKEFSAYVSRNLKGGRVGADPAMALGKFNFRSCLKGWIRREKWWFSALILCTIFCCTGWQLPYSLFSLLWLSVWLWPVIAFALAVGTTNKSRFFFLFAWLLLGIAWIIPLAVDPELSGYLYL
ncbi:hypothetical protein J7T55_003805 [Diaporthe amygdali]|uniref:uncharacterized protein n=1 Tax=Phomopsis amygdali TaxID=1214568 RepID=UPI0022FF0F36|nr:uncharacterized protein J7T55_003805 [Diaporthe amygdali]KAJ0117391.1 hypothetical protein J7T55_003805 [Diaporthe amygdali]